jgi:hypothetical protein
VLQGLAYADGKGLVPVVDMDRHKTLYNEPHPVEGTTNAWEYYFEQPGGVSLFEALKSSHQHSSGRTSGEFTSVFAVVPPEHLIKLGRSLVAKYIRPKPQILHDADEIIPAGVHARTLGIHVRGTELRKNISSRHPIPDLAYAYLERAKFLDRKHDFESVFLATDEEDALDMFKSAFGDRLRYLDVHRTPPATKIAADYSWLFDAERPMHRYLLGREVLLDVLLLARCGHFIGGVSNISHATAYFSDASQVVHPMNPLWVTPGSDGTSLGLRHLSDPAVPEALDPVGVLMAQKQELYRLLAETETKAAGLQRELKRAERSVVPPAIIKFFRSVGRRIAKTGS